MEGYSKQVIVFTVLSMVRDWAGVDFEIGSLFEKLKTEKPGTIEKIEQCRSHLIVIINKSYKQKDDVIYKKLIASA